MTARASVSGYSPSQPAPTSGYRLLPYVAVSGAPMVRAGCERPGCHWKSGGFDSADWAGYQGRRHAAASTVGRNRGLDFCDGCGCRSCLDSRDAHTQNTGAA